MKNCQCLRRSLICSVYYKAYNGWVWRKIFKTKVLKSLESDILRLVFANRVSDKRAVLLIFEEEFTGDVV